MSYQAKYPTRVCKRGHVIKDENQMIGRDKKRGCRTSNNERMRLYMRNYMRNRRTQQEAST